jgi:AcrR family transcriptional regulator
MQDGNETKTALLEAARQLIRECGYTGASVRKLTAAAGANLGAVNYHFGSREKLLNQALFESFLEWTDDIVQVDTQLIGTDSHAGPLEHLATGARPMIEAFPDRVPQFVVFLEALLQAQRSPELKSQIAAHYSEQRRRLGEMVSAGAPNPQRTARRLEVISSFLIAGADGLLLQSLIDPDGIPTGEELAAFYEGLAAATRASAPARTG